MRRLVLATLLVLAAVAALWRASDERRAAARNLARDDAPTGHGAAAAPDGPEPEDPPDRLRVQVLDAATGRPIAGATVEVESAVETTDQHGFASLTADLSGVGAPVRASARGFVPAVYWFDESDEDPWIPLRPGIPVTGRAIHADGAPAVRAEVELQVPDLRVAVPLDAMGRFELTGLPEGEEVMVRAEEEGYWPMEIAFAAGPSNATIEIVLGRGGECAGVVLDEERRPVADARVRVGSGNERAECSTDREGRFEIHGLPLEGLYRAHAETPDRRTGVSESFAIDEGGPPRRCEIVVRPTAYAVLRFEYPDGSPVTSAVVKFGNDFSEPGAQGEYRSRALGHGPLLIEATAGGWDTQTISIVVKPRVRNDVTLRLEERLSLSGTVVDRGGAAVPLAYVTLEGASTWTGEDGTFLLHGLRDKVGILRVERDGYEDASVEVRPGPGPVRVVLGRTPLVTGRIDPPPRLRSVGVMYGDGNLIYDAGALADREGRFAAGVGAGRHWLRIEVEGSVPWIFPGLDLAPGQTLDLGVLRASDGITLRGVVVDPEGAPVADADVGAYAETVWDEYSASTDEEGRFAIPRVVESPLTFHVEREGYVTKVMAIERPGAAPPLRVVLEPGGVLEVTGVEEEIAIDLVGGGRSYRLGPGSESFLTLPPGRYRVGGRIVEIRVGETTVVELGD